MSAVIPMQMRCRNLRLSQRVAPRAVLHSNRLPSKSLNKHASFFHPASQSGLSVRVSALCEDGSCLPEENGAVLVQDDLDSLLQILPADIRLPLMEHPNRANLLEVVLDLGRRPEARFLGSSGSETLRTQEITREDLDTAEELVGEFGSDNRAGITGTLHRISAIRNRKGAVVGLTCRVGRAVSGHIDMIRDMLDSSNSLLFLGRPGVGKTTVIRELARVMADELHKRVVIVDTSNEIGGDGDIPHPAIGGARRMQVPDPIHQHNIMIEAVENHMPEVVIVDEISTEAEALACRTIAERGVMLIGTAHGIVLENLVKNPTLTDLVGGVESVTLGDDEARARGTQKTVLERRGPPTFPVVVEIRERTRWIAHWVEDSVDCLLNSRVPMVQVRQRDAVMGGVSVQEMRYDAADQMLLETDPEAAPANVYETLGASDHGNDAASGWAQKLRSMSDQAALQEISIMGLNGSSVMYKNTSVLMPGTSKRKRSKAKARRS